jgi:MGT family glycosyltransferase
VSRVLVVVPPLEGHVNPTVPVAAALRDRGHEVAWAGVGEAIGPWLPDDAEILDVAPPGLLDVLQDRPAGLRGPAALRFLWEDFLVPLARATWAPLETAVAAYEPDLLLVDQQTFAGAAVAKKRGLRWATSATTTAELGDPFAAFPKVARWVRRQLIELQVDVGIPRARASRGDLRFSDDLVIVFSTPELVGAATGRPDHYRFVGASMNPARRAPADDFPWDWLAPDQPHVLVTLGTVSSGSGARFLDTVIAAVADQPFQTVIAATHASAVPLPDNVLVVERVPQLALLPHLDAVVCHGGHNTVCETLAHGLPLVVAPIRDDQPTVADQVARAGAGIRVKFGRVGPEALREAVVAALTDPALRQGAAVIRDSFVAAGGASAAATALEEFLCPALV